MSGDTRYGRGPNGRALKKDGTERKARRTLSPEEKVAQIIEMERKAYAGIGRKIFDKSDSFETFKSALGTFKAWVRECKSVGSEDKRAERRAYLERQLELLDAKGEAAEEFLPTANTAIETINGLFSRIGKAFTEAQKSGEDISDDTISEIISNEISDDVREFVESANNPENDPLWDFRAENLSEEEDDDTL